VCVCVVCVCNPGQINGNTVLKIRTQSAVKLMNRATVSYIRSLFQESIRIKYTPCSATRYCGFLKISQWALLLLSAAHNKFLCMLI